MKNYKFFETFSISFHTSQKVIFSLRAPYVRSLRYLQNQMDNFC